MVIKNTVWMDERGFQYSVRAEKLCLRTSPLPAVVIIGVVKTNSSPASDFFDTVSVWSPVNVNAN